MSRELTIKEIQQKQLDMLKLVIDMFEEKGLRYYLCGGTLLGAVRHKGFIPWDDDIDILIPRPDYDAFVELAKNQPLLPGFEFRSYSLGNSYDPCCRIYDLKTHVERDYVNDPNDQWLWIDILPMDGCPEDEAELVRMYKDVKKYKKIINLMESRVGKGRNLVKAIIKPVFKALALLFYDKRKLSAKIDEICRRYDFDTSRTVAGIAYGYGPQERMDRESFVKPCKFEFEGLELDGPSCYDTYLKALYGNYMELPPEDKRKVHFMKVYEVS